jgi:hypothetical protein
MTGTRHSAGFPRGIAPANWFRRAAQQGSVPAMARLGEFYLIGMAAPGTATPAALLRLESSGPESLFKRLYPQGQWSRRISSGPPTGIPAPRRRTTTV